MKIGKSGSGLTLRIPAATVKALNLKAGEEVHVAVTGGHKFEVCRIEEPEPEEDRVKRRVEAIEIIRSMRGTLPADYVFDREEIHERNWMRSPNIKPPQTPSS